MKVSSASLHRLALALIALCTYPGLQFLNIPFPGAFFFIILFLSLLMSVILYPRGTFVVKSLLGTAVPLCILLWLVLDFSSEAIGLEIIILFLVLYIAWLGLVIYSSVHSEKRVLFAAIVLIAVVALGGQFLVYKTQKEANLRRKNVDQYLTILTRIRDRNYEDPQSTFSLCTQLANIAGESSGRSCAIALAQAENDVSWCDSIQDEEDKMVSCYVPLTHGLTLQDQIGVCRSAQNFNVVDRCLIAIVENRPNLHEEDAQEVCRWSSEVCLTWWEWRRDREVVTR